MGCGVYWQQIHELERAMGTMEKYGISTEAEAYQTLFRQRGELFARVGTKFPRTTSLLGTITGLSPGVIKVWHDVESGWMSEARARPGAPPLYRAVSDEVAMAILKGEVTKELESYLLTPDEYLGE